MIRDENAAESDAEPRWLTRNLVPLGIGVMALIWGSTWLVIRIGLTDLPPFTALFLRFALSCAVFIPLAAILARREGGTRPPFSLSLIVGTFNFTGSYCIVYWVEQDLPSALASLLFATYPLMLAVAGHFVLPGERLRPLAALGFLIGFVGVAILLLTDVPAIGGEAIVPSLVMLGSPLVVTIGTLILKRRGAGFSSLLLNRDALAVSVAQVAAIALVTEWLVTPRPAMHFGGAAIFSVLYLALLGTVVTFGVYFWLLRTAPAAQLALIAYLTPAIAVALGAVVLGETVTAFTVVGAALILGGVALASRRTPRPNPRVQPPERSAGAPVGEVGERGATP
jgi:drug/metabolite transporter (DMT)-like permease